MTLTVAFWASSSDGVLPDVETLEVGVDGIGIADALHQRHLARIEELLHARHHRVEADLRIQRQDLGGGDADRWSRLKIGRIRIGNDGVEPIVATPELEDHQHAVVVNVLHGGGKYGLGEDRWHDDAHAGCGDAAHHEVAPADHVCLPHLS